MLIDLSLINLFTNIEIKKLKKTFFLVDFLIFFFEIIRLDFLIKIKNI
jgi:hypothetical protein